MKNVKQRETVTYNGVDSSGSSNSDGEEYDDEANIDKVKDSKLIGTRMAPTSPSAVTINRTRGYAVKGVMFVNDLVSLFAVVGALYSIGIGYNSLMFTTHAAYFYTALAFTITKMLVSVFIVYLQFQRTNQKWPYTHHEFISFLFYTATLILYGILYTKDASSISIAEAKYYEMAGLIFAVPPIINILSHLCFILVPKVLRVQQ